MLFAKNALICTIILLKLLVKFSVLEHPIVSTMLIFAQSFALSIVQTCAKCKTECNFFFKNAKLSAVQGVH